jgi:hypothetical protein
MWTWISGVLQVVIVMIGGTPWREEGEVVVNGTWKVEEGKMSCWDGRKS